MGRRKLKEGEEGGGRVTVRWGLIVGRRRRRRRRAKKEGKSWRESNG